MAIVRRVQLNEVVVIGLTMRAACRFASKLHAGNQRNLCGNNLILHFARDRNFVSPAAGAALVFDELVDGVGHQVERFTQHTELVAPFDPLPVEKSPDLNEQRRFVRVHRGRK